MKYLILFLSFFLSTGVSAQQFEFDTIPTIGISIEEGLTSGNGPVSFQAIEDYVITIGDGLITEVYLSVLRICEIVDAGKIRYGMVIEVVDGVTSITHVLLLPERDNAIWEKLATKE